VLIAHFYWNINEIQFMGNITQHNTRAVVFLKR